MTTTFSEMLLHLLGKHDRSQAWLATQIRVNRSTVGRWINDPKNKPASPETVSEIARVLGLDKNETQALLFAAFPPLLKLKSPVIHGPDRQEALASLPHPHFTDNASPLVGRKAELVGLQNCLTRAGEGMAQMVLVGGEAGIGKTRLVQDFITGVVPEICLHCAAKFYPGDQAVPYLALSEALDPLVEVGLIPNIDSVWLAEVAQIVTRLQVVRSELPLNPAIEMEHAPARRFHSLTEFITALANERTFIFWLDDLQWADDISLDFIRHLLTRRRHANLLIVGTYRSEEINTTHPMAELRSILSRENLLTEISLSPLPEQDVNQMVADLTMRDSNLWPLGRRLFQEVGGVPFFITEQIRLLQSEGWLDVSEWDAIPLSPHLQELIRHRYRQLDAAALQFMRFAAVVGVRFSFNPVRLAGDLKEETSLNVLDRLLAAGLVKKMGNGIYRFWHDQAQAVLYDDLRAQVSEEQWQRWHRRVGEAVETLYSEGNQREARLEQLARYFFEAEVWPKALAFLLQAGQKAEALFAYKSARSSFERAEALMMKANVEPELGQQLICAEGLGDVYTHLGLFDMALPRYQQAVGLTEANSASIARLGWKIARVYERQTKFNLAITWLDRSLAVLEPASSKAVEMRIRCLRGLIEVRRGQPAAALTWAEEALRLSKEGSESGSTQGLPPVHATLATGMVEEAQAHNLMGVILRAKRDLTQADEHCSRSAELYKALGHQRGMATAYANLATIAFDQERWSDADAAYRRALPLHQDIGNRYGEAMVLCNLADTCFHQGRLEEAEGFVEAGLRLATETLDSPFLCVLALETAAIIYLAQGDDEAAHKHLTTGLRLAETHDIQEWLVLIQIPLAEIYLRRSQLDEARQVAGKALQKAIEQGSKIKEAKARRILGRVYQAQGLPDQAKTELQASLSLVKSGERRYELGRTLVSLADLYFADTRRIKDGMEMIQQCIAIFQELGAALDLANAQVLRQRYELIMRGWTE